MDCGAAAIAAAESLQDMASGLVHPLKVEKLENPGVQNSHDSNAHVSPEVRDADLDEVTRPASRDNTNGVAQSQVRGQQHSSRLRQHPASKTETSVTPNSATGGPSKKVMAFSSVHDMIHASILAHGSCASLREIYQHCQRNGRILYKRSGGSRLITDNDHWKSQIRHALYTSGRFVRSEHNTDYWKVEKGYENLEPSLTPISISPGCGESALGADNSVNLKQQQNEQNSTATFEAGHGSRGKPPGQASPPKRKRSDRKRSSRSTKRREGPAKPPKVEAGTASWSSGKKRPHDTVTATATATTTVANMGSEWAQNSLTNNNTGEISNQPPPSLVSPQHLICGMLPNGHGGPTSVQEEESICPFASCEGLTAEQRCALVSILQQCDPQLAETFRSTMRRKGKSMRIGGVAKLMFRAFLNSLSMGLTISARTGGQFPMDSRSLEASGASEHNNIHVHQNNGSNAMACAPVANADSASSDAVWCNGNGGQQQ